MKLTERQAHSLLIILADSLRSSEAIFTLKKDIRTELYNKIIEQQSTDMVSLEGRSDGDLTFPLLPGK